MLRESVDSSNIAKIGYDPAQQLLEVEFRADRHGIAAVWQYSPVTATEHAELIAAPSIGKAFAPIKNSPIVLAAKVAVVQGDGTEVPA